MTSKPIADYAMIGNCQSAALVALDGSIDWWCAPKFDSPATFARILDPDAGHFRVSPAGQFDVSRRYIDGSMVLETTMRSESGTIVITDALAFGPNETAHQIGLTSPAAILRKIRCIAGTVDVAIEVAPRPEFGLISPLVEECAGGAIFSGGADSYVLSLRSRECERSHGTLRSRFALAAGEECYLALERSSTCGTLPKPWRDREIAKRIDRTIHGWQTWSDMHQTYRGAYHELVHHSGRVLQALTYQPTGAVVAAPTTSLPESPGGPSNWDYRYSWVRDASFTMSALWVAACPDEAQRYFRWLARTAAGNVRTSDLQVVFGVCGEHDLSERELPHLSGWRNSRPVRVGNAAWRQRQIDVYGEVAGAAFRFRDQVEAFDSVTQTFVIDAIERAADLWKQPDHGIWETRDEPQHFVHSKLMCWQALEAGIALADQLGVRDRVVEWSGRRDEIDAAIRTRGWSEKKQAYTQVFDSEDLDASALLMPISGFLSPDDPRTRSTIDAIARELADGHLVRRYSDTETGTRANGFVICSFWLAQAQAIVGDVDAARETFEKTVAHANDVALLAEQIDIASGEQLGNVPQAFSHVGLINAAAAIDTAARRLAIGSSVSERDASLQAYRDESASASR